MQIILLTHERELTRKTNTGRLALDAFPAKVMSIVWSRVAADKNLIEILASQQAKLLFPAEDAELANDRIEMGLSEHGLQLMQTDPLSQPAMPEQVVILDATWQEARKMLRQSPYLKAAARISLPPQTQQSTFILRRNQQEGGLCTAECIIALWHQYGCHEQATVLASLFAQLNTRH
ncbi:tRNA-uridine aminocarboxypropyltransferase [Shewanella morhuae]|uniref:tRNA-uridine aminocarboxypropyltransferase n=1 Tax=Shewanella morhuae TaxID=365591 RepID=UPI001BC08B4E|nr:tRNA-uridine aminocarboxypropyltransferase [Shewanella morhuae]GIU06398.1 DTW domain-containing protein [Shewanella morhuae]